MTALDKFREHMALCYYCRNHKDGDLCPEGEDLRFDVYFECLNFPNTVRGNESND
jgi:hypothetical protein